MNAVHTLTYVLILIFLNNTTVKKSYFCVCIINLNLVDDERSQGLSKDPAKDGGQAEDGSGERSLSLWEPNLAGLGAHREENRVAEGQDNLTTKCDPKLGCSVCKVI